VSVPSSFGNENQQLNAAAYTKTIALGTTGNGFPDFQALVSQAAGGGPWLGLSGATQGNAPANLTVTFNPSALTTPGTYTGNIQISSSTLPLTFTVPITMTITSNVTVAASPTSLTFNQAQGGPAPPSQNITLTSANGTATFTSSIQYSQGNNWLQVS